MPRDDAGYDDVLSSGAREMSDVPQRESRAPKRSLGRPVGVGALAIAVLTGGAVYVAARSGDVDSKGPQSVLPGSAFAFATVDLEPGGEHGKALGEFVQRFPSAQADSAAQLRERAVSAITRQVHLDYTQDVQPWLGRHAGVAGFPAAGGRPSFVIALEVKDARAAVTALASIAEPPAYAERDNYILIAPDKEALAAAVTATDDVALAAEPQFVADMARLDGSQLAVAWTDNKASADAVLYDMEHAREGDEFGGMETYFGRVREGAVGRTVMGLRAYGTYAELVGYTIGRGTAATGPLADLTSLPDTTIGAAFGANADSLLTGSGGGLFGSFGIAGKIPPLAFGFSSFLYGFGYSGEDYSEAQSAMPTLCAAASPTAAAGAKPGPVTSSCDSFSEGPERQVAPSDPVRGSDPDANVLIGSFASGTIALGSVPIPNAQGAPDLALIARIADPARAQKAIAKGKSLFADAFNGTPFTQEEGGVLTFASSGEYAGRLRGGALGETELFKTAMGPLGEQAEVAVFANLERVRDIVPGYPKELLPVSAIGMSSSREGDVTVLRVRLVSR
ncbi:MAG: DUF3352 domain-containing protein [Mycobacteriales bacterium]